MSSYTIETGNVGTGLTLAEGDILTINGALCDVYMATGSRINIASGGKLTGKVVIENGIISVEQGGIIDFDLTARDALDDMRISSLTYIQGNPKYTITINGAKQASGEYILSNGTNFNEKESTCFYVIGIDGTEYGCFTAGYTYQTVPGDDGSIWEDYRFYTEYEATPGSIQPAYSFSLDKKNSADGSDMLVLTVNSQLEPSDYYLEAPVPFASTTEPTNGYVIVTATFSDDSVFCECSVDGMNWIEYTSNGLCYTDNGKAFFRSSDAAGNVSKIAVYEVTNIDKDAPVAPVVSTEVAATFEGLMVSATFSDDSVQQEYSMDGRNWEAYRSGIPCREVGTVIFFRGIDEAGNISEVTEYEVKSLTPDPIGPAAPTASADITEPTTGNVIVTAVFGEDSVIREYSYDGRDWSVYDESLLLTENGTVYFRGTDANGNFSDVTAFEVDNIDRIAPDAPSPFARTNELTNQDVFVFARFSGDSVTREYNINGGNWEEYPDDGVAMSENGTIYFRGIDAAGNESEIAGYEVTNIDKDAPEPPIITADQTGPTNNRVVLTAAFDDDAVVQEYSFDGENWQEYRGSVRIENNCTVFFRGADEIGNISEIAEYEVANIDREAPAAPIVSADETRQTNGQVNVSAVFSNDSVQKEYSFDTRTWMDYSGPVVFSENGIVYFRGIDEAGNVSETVSYQVDNIDCVAPEAPRAVADTKEDTEGPVTVSATFSNDSVFREFSLDSGKTWQTYTDPIQFEKNGIVFFRGIDEAGNVSETQYTVNNIYEHVDQLGYADNGWNDWAFDDATGTVNEELNEAFISPAHEYRDEILPDKKFSINVDDWKNFLGKDDAGIVDTKDFVYIHVAENMRLCFTITATDKVKYTLYALTESEDRNGQLQRSLNTLQIKVLKKDKTGLYTYTSDIQVKGEIYDDTRYYLSVEGANKKGPLFYNVEFDRMRTEFYCYGNNDDDGGPDEGEFNEIYMDQNLLVEGWVGFGDEVDFYKFTLDHTAKLRFAVTAGTYLAFDFYEITIKNDKESLHKAGKTLFLKSELVEMPESGVTDNFMLGPGDYYFSVRSTNVQKCGEEEINYIIRLAPNSVFYEDADDGWNNWVYKRVDKVLYLNTELMAHDPIFLDETCDGLHLDKEGSVAKDYTYYDRWFEGEVDDTYANYVGIGDKIDYKKVSLGRGGKVSFSIHASDAAKFTVYKRTQDKNGAYSLKSLQTTSVKYDKTAGEYQAKTKLLLLDAGEYYISMEADEKKAQSFYNVYIYSNDDDPANSTVFFPEAGPNDDWKDMPDVGADSKNIGEIVKIGPEDSHVGDGWVGFGDPKDYGGFTIGGPAKLVFKVTASDKTRFNVWALNPKNKKNKFSLTSCGETTLSVNRNAEYAEEKYIGTVTVLMTQSGAYTYYYSIQSLNDSSGAIAFYDIDIDQEKSVFFDAEKMNDSGNDDWKTLNATAEKQRVITQKGTLLEGWVGYCDKIDYAGFSLENNANVSFTVTATDEASFSLYLYNERRGKVSLKAVQKKVSLKYNRETGLYEFTMAKKTLNKDTLYYIAMESKNDKKGGSADYSVVVNTFQPNFLDALTMPETQADVGLNVSAADIQDNLFAGQSADALSDAVIANVLDEEAAKHLNSELSILA